MEEERDRTVEFDLTVAVFRLLEWLLFPKKLLDFELDEWDGVLALSTDFTRQNPDL